MDASVKPGEPRDAESILRAIAEGTADTTGEEFFHALVRRLAQTMGFRAAFVSEFAGVNTRVRTLAFWDRDHYLDNFEYDLADTPCEGVLKGAVRYYPSGVRELFPLHSHDLAAFDAESYIAIPVAGRNGEVRGHLAVIHDKPLENPVRELSVFSIFGARVAGELDRRSADEALRKSERRLSSVLGSTMDAILTIDSAHRIGLFNRAAEAVFKCSAAWAIGQPVERFLSPHTRTALKSYFAETGASRHIQLWAPEGLMAVRADGEEFPIEATISPLEVDEESLHTIILRDVNDRERAYQRVRHLQLENENLQEVMQRQGQLDGLIAHAPCMQHLLDQIRRVAGTDATVLISGETGAGKEVVARAIHRSSKRASRPLVSLNCAALPSELIESELFGHERGAFTGATNLRRGRFELAHEGTLFLDEVGELSPQAQAKLLRVLQENEFERVGGSRPIAVDVRLIAATNRKLEDMVACGSFRSDLYYRLNVFPVKLPPLRERRDDIVPLALHFLARYGRKLGRDFSGILPVSLERIRRYNWPGNVRELQNVIERSAILCHGPLLEIRDPLLDAAPPSGQEPPSAAVGEIMRTHIERILLDCDWTIEGPRGAAALLGLKPSTLRHRMKQLGIVKPRPSAPR